MQGMDKPLHFIAVLYIRQFSEVVIQTVLLKMVRAKRKTNQFTNY